MCILTLTGELLLWPGQKGPSSPRQSTPNLHSSPEPPPGLPRPHSWTAPSFDAQWNLGPAPRAVSPSAVPTADTHGTPTAPFPVEARLPEAFPDLMILTPHQPHPATSEPFAFCFLRLSPLFSLLSASGATTPMAASSIACPGGHSKHPTGLLASLAPTMSSP